MRVAAGEPITRAVLSESEGWRLAVGERAMPVPVPGAALDALAEARAKGVIAWLLGAGKVDPARVFQVREGGKAQAAVVFTLK